jgi:hypothetical protein
MVKAKNSGTSIEEKINDRKKSGNHTFRNVMLGACISLGSGIFGPIYLIEDEMPLKPTNASFDEAGYEDYLFQRDIWMFKHSAPFYIMTASAVYTAVTLNEQNKYNLKRKKSK